jgi:preprotein translocase subunit SecD
MLEYARWKYILVSIVLLLSLLLALPNIFGDDYALQLTRKDKEPIQTTELPAIEARLKENGVTYKSLAIQNGNAIVRFDKDTEQLKARDVVKDEKVGLSKTYLNAMMYASRAPRWVQVLGLRAMPLGLDLRGGLYLLYQVDIDGAVAQLLDSYEQDFRKALTKAQIVYTDVSQIEVDSDLPNGLRILLPPGTDTAKARAAMTAGKTDITCRDRVVAQGAAVDCIMSPAQVTERRNFAIDQNIATLRNRVNELGVSEPIVQRQGADRIVVQLAGVQNSAEVKDTLGKVATLEYRMVYQDAAPSLNGPVPAGAKRYKDREGRPVLLKRDVIVTGDQLVNATPVTTQDGPGVSIKLSSSGGDEMLKNTQANVGKPMAVVFIEQRRVSEELNGKRVDRTIKDETVISIATIRGVFGDQFETTGLTSAEANDLSKLLKGGALAAPISIADEQVVTASLGAENIEKGVTALIIGMAALFVFMIIYYHLFGVVANLVLLANVVVLAALLSLLGTVLSLPGIAGIILTVGMAVDANVLIYERIREELRNGVSPQAAIKAGFEKAFSAILDSNVTTFIAGFVLFLFGTGPIRGFAIVLSLGILTSMFTALMGSRALLTLMFGGKRKLATLPIG